MIFITLQLKGIRKDKIPRGKKIKRNRYKLKKKRIRKPKKIWSQDEDELLLKLIDQYGPAKWSVISSFMENRQGK